MRAWAGCPSATGGNRLATIVLWPAGKYRVDIHEPFLAGLGTVAQAQFTQSGECRRMTVVAPEARRVLRKSNVGRLVKGIRIVNRSEELTFEQILMADNPPSPQSLLIDRQVRDHHTHRPFDLFGLIAGDDMPDEIGIDGTDVDGPVVVGGYWEQAVARVERLMASHLELRMRVFRTTSLVRAVTDWGRSR
ncbi:MAG: hypothetical protein WCP98_15410 [Actinomycetes bacterium]